MKNLSEEINISIKEDLSLINSKINGVVLLEILKYKIIERLKAYIANSNFENKDSKNYNSDFEDDLKKINIKIKSCESKIVDLISELKTHFLIICINGATNINIEDFETKKRFDYKCSPMTGIVLSKGSRCSLNYEKNSVVLEISLIEKIINIEKYE